MLRWVVMMVIVLLVPAAVRADPSTTSPQQGYDLGEVWMPRGVALADAQVALGTSTAALYNNPGSMPFARTYHFEALGSVSPEARRFGVGGAVVDSFGRFSGGFGGSWNSMDPDGINRQWVDLRWATAIGLGDKLGIGAGGRYLRVTQDVAKGPLGPSTLSDGSPKSPVFNVPTFDIGMTFAPIPQLRIGAVGKNLTNPQNSLLPVTFASGVGVVLGAFSAEADVLVDFNTWSNRATARLSTGAELFLFERVPVRLGYRFDQGQRTHALGWGLGWVDKKFSVEISARRDFIADNPMMVIVLGLRYFYDPGAADAKEGSSTLAKRSMPPIGM